MADEQPESTPAAPDPTQAASPSPEAASSSSPASTETPAAPAAEAAPASAARPVAVNQFTRRSGEDALLGSWVDVISGEYAGRRGVYFADESHDPQTGYPLRALVRTRDAQNELIVVDYARLRPSAYTGGR